MVFNTEKILNLLKKLETNTINDWELEDLLSLISVHMIVTKNENKFPLAASSNDFIKRYHKWASNFDNLVKFSSAQQAECIFLKSAIDKYFASADLAKNELSSFENLVTLSKVWARPLERNRTSIQSLLSFLMSSFYQIPDIYIDEIFLFLNTNWKVFSQSRTSMIYSHKIFDFARIEEYFFTKEGIESKYKDYKRNYEIHTLPKLDRYFSIVSKNDTAQLFLPKLTDFDPFESSIVVHELQHIVDKSKFNVFESEFKALKSELEFLDWSNMKKRGKYAWLEANLFYPMIILECELKNLINGTEDMSDFASTCQRHGLKAIEFPAMGYLGGIFQHSLYCAAVMSIEPQWKNYFLC